MGLSYVPNQHLTDVPKFTIDSPNTLDLYAANLPLNHEFITASETESQFPKFESDVPFQSLNSDSDSTFVTDTFPNPHEYKSDIVPSIDLIEPTRETIAKLPPAGRNFATAIMKPIKHQLHRFADICTLNLERRVVDQVLVQKMKNYDWAPFFFREELQVFTRDRIFEGMI